MVNRRTGSEPTRIAGNSDAGGHTPQPKLVPWHTRSELTLPYAGLLSTHMARTAQKSARAATRFSANYKARSRARIAQMAAQGRGHESLAEVASLLGIDLAHGERPRLTRVRGFRIG